MPHHKYQKPHHEAEQCDCRLDTRYGTQQRSHTLAPLEPGKDGEYMTEDNDGHGNDFEVDNPRRVEMLVVLKQRHKAHSHKPFHKVDNKDGERSTLAQHAQHIGCSGISATLLADIHTVVSAANPHGTRH